jgi:L-fucose mutarotase/ribose pyranase (RbsD/FucU family)
MKKENLILAVVIAALLIYLGTSKKDKNNYSLPPVEEIKSGQITDIEVTRGKETTQIKKQGDVWVLTDKAYPAEKVKIDNMLKAIEKIQLTALVSENKDFSRYELDDETGIRVVAKGNGSVLRSVDVGKTAPTYNHTFVKLAEDPKVYEAKGDFKPHFEKTVDQLRDKVVLPLKIETVDKMQLTKNQVTKSVHLKQVEPSKKGEKQKEGETTVSTTPEKKWEEQSGEAVDKDTMGNLLDTIKALKCTEYASNDSKNIFQKKPVLCQIRIQGEGDLIIYEIEDEKYPAISTGNNYPFYLSKFDGNNLLKSVDKILGIKKGEDKVAEPKK